MLTQGVYTKVNARYNKIRDYVLCWIVPQSVFLLNESRRNLQ